MLTIVVGTTALVVGLTVSVFLLVRPTRTIIPLYAGMIPVGSLVKLPIPLPAPFNSLSSVLGAIAIAAVLGHVIVYRQGRIPSIPVAAWVAFLAWAMVTTFWAVDWRAAVDVIFVASPLVLMMVVVGITLTDELDLDALRIGIICGGIAVGGYALFLLLTGSALPVHGTTERFSVASTAEETNPNQLAASLLLPMVLSMEWIFTGGPPWWRPALWRALGAIGATLVIVAIVMSGSRGGVLAALIGFVLTLVFWWRRVPEVRPRVTRVIAATLFTVIGLGSLIFVLLSVFPEGRVADTLRSDAIQRLIHVQTGSSGRTEIWTTGYLACERYCDWGGGMDSFPVIFDQIFPFSAAAKNVGQDRPAHNVYLELAVETGFIGLTLFGLAILAEWKLLRSREMRKVGPSVSAALIALLTTNVFEGQIWFKYFWILFVFVRVAEGTNFSVDEEEISIDLSRRATVRPLTAGKMI
jgi:O-antigen ligase